MALRSFPTKFNYLVKVLALNETIKDYKTALIFRLFPFSLWLICLTPFVLIEWLSYNFLCLQLPGLLSLSTKFLPTVMNLLRKLAEEGQIPATNNPQRNPAAVSKSFPNGSKSSDTSSSASSGVTSSGNGTEYSSPTKEE